MERGQKSMQLVDLVWLLLGCGQFPLVIRLQSHLHWGWGWVTGCRDWTSTFFATCHCPKENEVDSVHAPHCYGASDSVTISSVWGKVRSEQNSGNPLKHHVLLVPSRKPSLQFWISPQWSWLLHFKGSVTFVFSKILMYYLTLKAGGKDKHVEEDCIFLVKK